VGQRAMTSAVGQKGKCEHVVLARRFCSQRLRIWNSSRHAEAYRRCKMRWTCQSASPSVRCGCTEIKHIYRSKVHVHVNAERVL
jgi:hypothetical protein